MIASLPMYDRAETRAAHDRLWALIREALPGAPDKLTRGTNPWDDWENPDLLLSQTCSLPYRAKLHGKVQLVGTPVHDLPCPSGTYYSVIIAHTDDPRTNFADFNGASLAINDPLSQSGYAAPQALAGQQKITLKVTEETGSHQASFEAVAAGKADLAALDAVTWHLITRHAPNPAVRIVTKTPPTPALPYITSLGQDADLIYKTLATAIAALTEEDRQLLCLKGLTRLPESAYLDLPLPVQIDTLR